MKKIISFLLAMIMCFAAFTSAGAAGEDWDKIVFELDSLRIINKNTDINLPVTRGEFSQMVTRLLGLASLLGAGNIESPFTDVKKDAPYAVSVALLNQMGIINGTSATTFSPDEYVTIDQAVKVMVVCTGYDSVALEKGGWHNGYLAVGASIGLLDDVKRSDPNARGEIYKVLYNALDVRMLKPVYGTGDLELSNDTIRTSYLGINSTDLYNLTGVVDASSFSYVNTEPDGLGADEVIIDSVIYKIGGTDALNYVGQRVNFFAYEQGGKYILHSIRAEYDQKILKLDAEDVSYKSGTVLKYIDGGKERSVNISTPEKLVCNGIRVRYPADSMYLGTIGSVTLIDHTGDGKYDVTMVERYESYMAKSYKDGLVIFNENTLYEGKNSLYINPNDDTKKIKVVASDGEEITSFSGDRVISVFADAEKTRYKFVVSDMKHSGTLSEIGEDIWVVGGKDFKLDGSVALMADIGQDYDIYLNYKGEIVFASEKTSQNYAYILDTASNGSFKNPQARILEAGKVGTVEDVNVEDIDAVSERFLIAQNKAISVRDFADKVSINGTSYKRGSLNSVLASLNGTAAQYSVNSDGEISSIDVLTNYGGSDAPGATLSYNVNEMTFGGKQENVSRGFAINSDTKVICVPVGSFTDEDAVSVFKLDKVNNDAGLTVLGFDRDEITKRAKLLVMYVNLNAQQVRPISIGSSKTAIVSDIRQKADASGDSVTVVELLVDKDYVSYEVLDNSKTYTSIAGLKTGDVVNYLVNLNGKLEIVQKLCTSDKFVYDFYTRYPTGYEECFGKVESIVYDEVDSPNNMMVDIFTIAENSNSRIYNIPIRNKPPVYIYDSLKDEVTPAEIKDVVPGGDKVYVIKKDGKNIIKALVIVR